MFWMKFPEHSGDTSTGNRFGTSGTQGAFQSMKMGLTIRFPFVFKKVSVRKWLATSGTNEAIGTPLAV